MKPERILLIAALVFSTPAWAMTVCARWVASMAVLAMLMGTPHDGDHDHEPTRVALMQALATDHEAAAVVWVTYDSRADFRESRDKFRKFFTERAVLAERDHYLAMPNRPGVDPRRFHELSVEAELEDFGATIERALRQLDHARSPRLYIAINAHGAEGFVGAVCRQKGDSVDHLALLNVVDEKVQAFRKHTGTTPELAFFVDTCHAGALVRTTRAIFNANATGKYENGTGERFRLPITVVTAGHDLEETFDNHLVDFLNWDGEANRRRYAYDRTPPRFALEPGPYLSRGRLGSGHQSHAPVFWSSHDPGYAQRVNAAALEDMRRIGRERSGPASARLGGTWIAVDSETLLKLVEAEGQRRDIPAQMVGIVRELVVRYKLEFDAQHRRMSPAQQERAIAIFLKAAFPESPGAVAERPSDRAAALDALGVIHHLPVEKFRHLLPKVAAMYVAIADAKEKSPEKAFEHGFRAVLHALAPEIPWLLEMDPTLAKTPDKLEALLARPERERVAHAVTLLPAAREREFLLKLVANEASSAALYRWLGLPNPSEAEIRAWAALPTLDRFKIAMHPDAAAPVGALFLQLPADKRATEFEALFPNDKSVAEAREPSTRTLRALILLTGWTSAEKDTLAMRLKAAESAGAPP